jgi:hypothetical protein
MVPAPVLCPVKVRVAELPMVDLAEAHGAGGSDDGIAPRDGAGNGRTRALLPVRIHGGDRHAVGRASRQTRG